MSFLDTNEETNVPLEFERFLQNWEKILVKTELEYKSFLSRLKNDFQQRFEINTISPETGLKGFEMVASIGSGSFGKVDIIKDSANNFYAVKTLQKAFCVGKKKVSNVINEKRLLNSFRFPFVISLEWSRKDYKNVYLGLPVFLGGDLFSLYMRWRYFSEDDARFYAAQICLALEYLHILRVVHRDLKLENILIDKTGFIKLTDFGSAKLVADRTMSFCGTPEYMSPELINGTPYFTGPDWWALGVLIFEMVFGSSPFAAHTSSLSALFSKISDAIYVMPRKFSGTLKNLIKQIFVVDFTKRLGCRFDGADEVKRHSWFKNINWISLLRREVQPPFEPMITKEADTRYFLVLKNKKLWSSPRQSYSGDFEDF